MIRKARKYALLSFLLLFGFGLSGNPALGDTIDLPPEADSYVDDADTTGNHGFRDYMIVGEWDGAATYRTCRSYMKFDLSSVPSGVNISSATLFVYCRTIYNTPVTVGSHYLGNDSWQEYNITWNNAPTGFSTTATDSVSLVTGFNAWDVTGDVNTAYGGDGVLSLVLKLPTEGANADGGWFDTREYHETTCRPYLHIEYAPPDSVDISPIHDSYVDDADTGGNHGWRDYMIVGEWDGASPYRTCRTYMQFDLGSVPAGKKIVSATLNVNCRTIYNTTVNVGAHYLGNDSWTENTITWNNAPTNFNTTATATAALVTGYNAWTVTSDAQTAYKGDGVLSLVLKLPTEGADADGGWFDTDEYSDPAYRPYLTVAYADIELPVTDIKANGSDGPLSVPSTQTVALTISLDPKDYPGATADWWILADKSGGSTYSWVYSLPGHWTLGTKRAHVGGLITLNNYTIHNGTIPLGTWDMEFSVDYPDNVHQGTCKDTIQITVY